MICNNYVITLCVFIFQYIRGSLLFSSHRQWFSSISKGIYSLRKHAHAIFHSCKNVNFQMIFSSPEPKAHRRAYSIPMVRRPSFRRPFTMLKHLLLVTAGLIKAKFYVELSWVGGTIFCSRHLGHMTKMAATPIYGKNPSRIFFSRTGGPIFTKLGM